MKRHSGALAGLFVGIMAVALTVHPASAANDPPGLKRFEKAQAKRSFVVYAPTKTFGLPLTEFQTVPCSGNAAGDALSFSYGSQSPPASRWIGPMESPGRPCLDGPDGIASEPVATFTVNGAKVRVMGSCPDLKPTCKKSTRALAKRQAYTTVTLPGSAVCHATAYAEIYTQNISVAEVRTFIRGLVPAT